MKKEQTLENEEKLSIDYENIDLDIHIIFI